MASVAAWRARLMLLVSWEFVAATAVVSLVVPRSVGGKCKVVGGRGMVAWESPPPAFWRCA